MNEQMIRAVIAINNRCIEQFQNRSFVHVLSELRGAIALMNQGVTIVGPTAGTSNLTNGTSTGMQQQPSSSMPVQTSQGIPNNHRLEQQASAIVLIAQVKFCLPVEEPLTNGTATASTPIAPSFHLLRIVSIDQNATQPSMIEQQHPIRNIDAISKEESHLISAALLYNMGILLHLHANACHLSTHDAPSNSTYSILALNIYELLIQLSNNIDIWNVSTSSTQDTTLEYCFYLRVIQMLAYNNYGAICYAAGRYDTYQHCMKNLQCQLQFFSNVIRNDGNNLPNSGELQTICNNLRLNALFAKLFPSPMLASAA